MGAVISPSELGFGEELVKLYLIFTAECGFASVSWDPRHQRLMVGSLQSNDRDTQSGPPKAGSEVGPNGTDQSSPYSPRLCNHSLHHIPHAARKSMVAWISNPCDRLRDQATLFSYIPIIFPLKTHGNPSVHTLANRWLDLRPHSLWIWRGQPMQQWPKLPNRQECALSQEGTPFQCQIGI